MLVKTQLKHYQKLAASKSSKLITGEGRKEGGGRTRKLLRH
jgi:hypothetical protein